MTEGGKNKAKAIIGRLVRQRVEEEGRKTVEDREYGMNEEREGGRKGERERKRERNK